METEAEDQEQKEGLDPKCGDLQALGAAGPHLWLTRCWGSKAGRWDGSMWTVSRFLQDCGSDYGKN